jgi:hypothetical protein
MNTSNPSVSALVAALNDGSRTRIGNPLRGTNHVSIATTEVFEASTYGAALASLNVVFRTNFRRDQTGHPVEAFVSIYDLDGLRRLLDAVHEGLKPGRRLALQTLVRARGPVPEELLRQIDVTVEWGKSYEYIAKRMTDLGIIDGVGKGWTAKKLRRIHRAYLERPPIASETEAHV